MRETSIYKEALHQGKLWHPSLIKHLVYGVWVHGPENFLISSNEAQWWYDITGNNNHLEGKAGGTGHKPNMGGCYLTQRIVCPNMIASNGAYFVLNSGVSANVTAICALLRYKDGQDSSFDDYAYILSHAAGFGRPRVMGNTGLSTIYSDTNGLNDKALNGNNTFSATPEILPTGESTCLFAMEESSPYYSTFTNGPQLFGSSAYSTSRTWEGCCFAAAIFNESFRTYSSLNKRIRGLIEGFLVWDTFGHGSNLSYDHTFRNRPPLIGD